MKVILSILNSVLWFALVVLLTLVLLATALIYAVVRLFRVNINFDKFIIPGIRFAR